MENDEPGQAAPSAELPRGVPVSAPGTLPAFPNARRVKSKTWRGGRLLRRWKNATRIFEWDPLHGAVEMYDRWGDHIGEFDPVTGKLLKDRDPKRRIEP